MACLDNTLYVLGRYGTSRAKQEFHSQASCISLFTQPFNKKNIYTLYRIGQQPARNVFQMTFQIKHIIKY